MPTLFVVEDNVLLADTLVMFLRKHGNLSVAGLAPSAESALEELTQHAVDLVLVDVALPGMNGVEFVSMVRKIYPTLPCLMLSGHDEVDYVRRALAAGARGYVLKSFPNQILEAIRRVLAGEIYVSEELQRSVYH
jgi:DNA-binding NarL/FixJ family response regulator